MAKAKKKLDADDAPELTPAMMARAERVADGPDALLQAIKRRARGRQKAPTKRLVSLRLSPDVLETYKGTGRGWQSRIDEDLKKSAKRIRAAR